MDKSTKASLPEKVDIIIRKISELRDLVVDYDETEPQLNDENR